MGAPATDRAKALRDFGLGDEDLVAWRESGLAASRYEDWLVDRGVRWPSGLRARATYGAAA